MLLLMTLLAHVGAERFQHHTRCPDDHRAGMNGPAADGQDSNSGIIVAETQHLQDHASNMVPGGV